MKKCTIKFLSFFLTIISFTSCSQNNEEILVEANLQEAVYCSLVWLTQQLDKNALS